MTTREILRSYKSKMIKALRAWNDDTTNDSLRMAYYAARANYLTFKRTAKQA